MATKHKRKSPPKVVVKKRRNSHQVAKPPEPQASPAMVSMPTTPNGGVPPTFPHNH